MLTSGQGVYAGSAVPVITPASPTDSAIASQTWRAELERTVLDAEARGIRTSVVRPSIVYGNGGSGPLIAASLEHVANGGAPFHLASGQNAIATVHVRDLARIFVELLEGSAGHRSINVAMGSVLGLELAHATADLLGARVEPVSYSVERAVDAMGPAGAMIGTDLRIAQ